MYVVVVVSFIFLVSCVVSLTFNTNSIPEILKKVNPLNEKVIRTL